MYNFDKYCHIIFTARILNTGGIFVCGRRRGRKRRDEKKKEKGRRRRKDRRKMKLGLHQSSSPDPNEDHFKIVSNHWSFLWGMEFGCDTKDGMKMKRSARAFGLLFDQIDFYLWASYYLICESDFLFANNFSLSAGVACKRIWLGLRTPRIWRERADMGAIGCRIEFVNSNTAWKGRELVDQHLPRLFCLILVIFFSTLIPLVTLTDSQLHNIFCSAGNFFLLFLFLQVGLKYENAFLMALWQKKEGMKE